MENTEFFAINTRVLKDVCGEYDIKLDKNKIHYNGVEYTYLSSGLCREVYRSECGKWVLKIPKGDLYDNFIIKSDALDYTTMHNVLEYRAYINAPTEFKPYLAYTEMLDYGWLRQEYVEVFESILIPNLRELGKRPGDGSICVFDFDRIIDWALRYEECTYDACIAPDAHYLFDYGCINTIKRLYNC